MPVTASTRNSGENLTTSVSLKWPNLCASVQIAVRCVRACNDWMWEREMAVGGRIHFPVGSLPGERFFGATCARLGGLQSRHGCLGEHKFLTAAGNWTTMGVTLSTELFRLRTINNTNNTTVYSWNFRVTACEKDTAVFGVMTACSLVITKVSGDLLLLSSRKSLEKSSYFFTVKDIEYFPPTHPSPLRGTCYILFYVRKLQVDFCFHVRSRNIGTDLFRL
jgi:hypothetical protein